MNPEWQGRIQKAYRDFLAGRQVKARRSQAHMIADIAKSFAGIKEDEAGLRQGQQHISVIEAGTGTGKTLAYLLATLPVAQAREKRLVISTATIALQEQLLLRDLPDLLKLTDLEFTFALAKGRGRYVCTAQLVKAHQAREEQGESTALDLFQAELLQHQGGAEDQALEELVTAFAAGEWNGEQDSLPTQPPAALWNRLTIDHQRCTNRRCPHFASACPFFNARRALEQADIIVANHDLVLADLALGGGVILPDPAQTYYVFDEAHHLPDKAIKHFAASFRFNLCLNWLRLLRKSQPDLMRTLGSSASAKRLLEQLLPPIEALERDLGVLYGQLSSLPFESSTQGQAIYRWSQGVLAPELHEFAQQLTLHFASLSRLLEQLVNQLKEAQDPEKNTSLDADLAAECQPLLALLLVRAQGAHQLWSLCSQPDPEQQPPLARWLTRFILNDGDQDLEMSASPVTAAGDLAYKLWSRCFGATLTSATLTALGRFDRLRQRAGLSAQTLCKTYPSPFNYAQLGVLEVPPEACDPLNSAAHSQAIIDYLVRQPEAERATLVLFSARKQMQEVYDALPKKLQKITLTQDQLSKNRLLKKHLEQVDQQQPSMIFGLASLAEGIDLPGRYLTHVVIARLPFAMPDDPVEATLAEWIEQTGGNPFMQISVPDASIRLVQACGRLIRTEADQGRITLMDKRILTKRYGQQLLNSLPPFRRELHR